jgi:hypothetical protein
MMVEYQRERRRGRTLGGRQRKGHERGCNDLSGHRGFTNNRDSKTFWSFKQVAATLRKEELLAVVVSTTKSKK